MKTHDPQAVLLDVGRRIAELRHEAGMTQQALAERMDVTDKYLQRIEAGTENLTLRSLIRLASLLDVELPALFVPPTSREVRPGRPPKKRS